MKIRIPLTLLVCAAVWVGPRASEQPAADCRPNPLNIPGAPYPCIYPDNRVMFRVAAPDAQRVRVRLGQGFDMSKEADGLWYVTTTPQVVGFHYYSLAIDGAVVADPATRTFFGSGWHNSAIEVPEPTADADATAFNRKVKVLFLGIGSAEGAGTKTFSDQLTQAGIKNIYYESPGTAHEWLTWRRCFKEFAPLLFR